jgi:hypothetical protein
VRILGPKLHRTLDFVIVAVLLIGPLLAGLGGVALGFCVALAILHLLVTLATSFPPGGAKPISLMLHGIIELAAAILLVAMPYLAGFGPGSPAKRFYVTMAAVIFVIWLLTDYRGTEAHTA